MTKIVATNGKHYHCSTKEQYLDAKLLALLHVQDDQLADTVSLDLLRQIYNQATELYGPTQHHVEDRPKVGVFSDNLQDKYVCPQCGPDSNGSQVHSLTHHTFPPYTIEEAKASLQPLLDQEERCQQS